MASKKLVEPKLPKEILVVESFSEAVELTVEHTGEDASDQEKRQMDAEGVSRTAFKLMTDSFCRDRLPYNELSRPWREDLIANMEYLRLLEDSRRRHIDAVIMKAILLEFRKTLRPAAPTTSSRGGAYTEATVRPMSARLGIAA